MCRLDRMRIYRIAPSFVYFLSGILAAAAVNLVTAVPTGSVSAEAAKALGASATCWLGTSLILAAVAMLLEEIREETIRLAGQHLERTEIEALRKSLFKREGNRLSVLLLVSTCFVYGGVHYAFRARSLQNINLTLPLRATPPVP